MGCGGSSTADSTEESSPKEVQTGDKADAGQRKRGIVIFNNQNLTTLPNYQKAGKPPRELWANDNNLSRLTKEQMNSWSGLEEIQLRNNRFAKVPDGLSVLTKLTIVDLSDNPFNRIGSCDSLPSISRLTVLKLASCGLRQIPPALIACRTIEQLDISGNKDIDWKSANFPGLKSLRSLSLADCKIKGKLPESIKGCTGLTSLNITGNPALELTEAKGFGSVASSLQELIVDNCTWTELPRSVCSLKKLHTLRMRETADPGLDGLGFLTNLAVIDLSGSSMTELPEALAQGQETIQDLNLTNCKELETLAGLASMLPRLTALNFTGTAFSRPGLLNHRFLKEVVQCSNLASVQWTNTWDDLDFSQALANPLPQQQKTLSPATTHLAPKAQPRRASISRSPVPTTQIATQNTSIPWLLCALPNLRKVNDFALGAMESFAEGAAPDNALSLIKAYMDERSPVYVDFWHSDISSGFTAQLVDAMSLLLEVEELCLANFSQTQLRYAFFLSEQIEGHAQPLSPRKVKGKKTNKSKEEKQSCLIPPMDVAAMHWAHMLFVSHYVALSDSINHGSSSEREGTIIPCRYRDALHALASQLMSSADEEYDAVPEILKSKKRWEKAVAANTGTNKSLQRQLSYDAFSRADAKDKSRWNSPAPEIDAPDILLSELGLDVQDFLPTKQMMEHFFDELKDLVALRDGLTDAVLVDGSREYLHTLIVTSKMSQHNGRLFLPFASPAMRIHKLLHATVPEQFFNDFVLLHPVTAINFALGTDESALTDTQQAWEGLFGSGESGRKVYPPMAQ